MIQLLRPHSDDERQIYFWQHVRIDGARRLFCSRETNFTPHGCDWHNWWSDVPCYICAEGEWYPYPGQHESRALPR